MLGNGRFSGPEIPPEKYSIPLLRRDRESWKIFFCENIGYFFLHNLHYMKYYANINVLYLFFTYSIYENRNRRRKIERAGGRIRFMNISHYFGHAVRYSVCHFRLPLF